MAPRISKTQYDKAKKAGGVTARKLPDGAKKEPIPTPAPQAVMPDMSAVERSAAAMEESVRAAQESSKQQADELGKLIATLGVTEPMRLKVHRDMEKGSPTYLLIQYIDVIPVQAVRKLNS